MTDQSAFMEKAKEPILSDLKEKLASTYQNMGKDFRHGC